MLLLGQSPETHTERTVTNDRGNYHSVSESPLPFASSRLNDLMRLKPAGQRGAARFPDPESKQTDGRLSTNIDLCCNDASTFHQPTGTMGITSGHTITQNDFLIKHKP